MRYSFGVNREQMMTPEEIVLVKWYRALPTLQRLAVNCLLVRGDWRLVFYMFPIIKGNSHQSVQIATSECRE